jgi:lipopolysaccharide/colanic/teichoic acid biosynthesis glycosyltransferase
MPTKKSGAHILILAFLDWASVVASLIAAIVLRGRGFHGDLVMSLVGPRPCLPYEWNHYQEWHKQRASVTPGCTGVWQVFGRSLVGFQDMVIFDLFYSQNASLGLDLWILLKTIPVMVTGRGGK